MDSMGMWSRSRCKGELNELVLIWPRVREARMPGTGLDTNQ